MSDNAVTPKGSDTARHDDGNTSHGRGWAQFGFGMGVLSSIAANVAHSYVPPVAVVQAAAASAQPVHWSPAVGAIVAAAFWPIALLVAIEVMSRVTWSSAWYWWVTRWVGMTAVAVIAAVISYRHMNGVLVAWGEDSVSATIGPLAVDGLMVVCSGALVATLPKSRRVAVDSISAATAVAPVAPANVAPAAPAPATQAAETCPATPAPAARRTRAAKTRRARNGSDNQDAARRRVAAGESCATVAIALGVSKKTVERWTSDIREQRQAAANNTAEDADSDSDSDDQERVS